MKILVIGGMHGNEPLGIKLVRLLTNQPLKNIDSVMANFPAVSRAVRSIDTDLNRSFPGNINSENYTERRAAELLDMCTGYDIVLDFHNTHCPGNDCSFIGAAANNQLDGIANLLSISRMIVVDYDCLNKYAANCLSVEISLNSRLNEVQAWYQRLKKLAAMEKVYDTPTVEKYRFVYRITLDDKQRLRLDKLGMKAFQAIPEEIARQLGIDNPAYPIFINDKYTPYNYGGLLNKLNVSYTGGNYGTTNPTL